MRVPQTAQPPPGVATDPTRASLEGEWRLVSMQMADGGSRRVTGFLRFDRFATITVRAELAPDEPAARAPQTVVAAFTAVASPSGGVFEFAGLREEVGREQFTPDAVQMGEWRYFEVTGPTLRVSVRDRSGRAAATLVFERQ